MKVAFLSGRRKSYVSHLCGALLAGAFLSGASLQAVPLFLTASTVTPSLGQTVTLTAMAGPTRTGNVLFFDGTTPIGVATLSGAIPNTATITTSLLPAGARSLSVRNADAVSPALLVTVTPNPDTLLTLQTAVSGFSNTTSVAVADLNQDGYPDLIISDNADGNSRIAVSLGTAMGTFGAPTFFLAGSNLGQVVVADLNGDGKPDVLVGDVNSFFVLLGNGDGTLQTAAAVAVGEGVQGLGVADMDNNGVVDAVVVTAAGVAVLLGNGDGTFGTPVVASGGSGFAGSFLAIADFNNDGNADVAVQNSTTNAQAWVLLGLGDGTLTSGPTLIPGFYSSGPVGLVAFDMNLDGNMDLLLGDKSNSIVFQGFGDGSFMTDYQIAKAAASVAVGDFNGDGNPDIIFGDSGDNNIDVWEGNGTGYFVSTFQGNTGGSGVLSSLVVADFNHDGRSDVAGVTRGSTDAVYFGGVLGFQIAVTDNGGGNFSEGQTGSTFTVSVSNSSSSASSGLVTVSNAVSSGLTVTAIGGTGWTCDANSLTCTRMDALAGNSTFPNITITFSVGVSAPASGSESASVSGTIASASSSASGADMITIAAAVGQTISFGAFGPYTYGGGAVTLGATATSGLAVQYSVSGPCSVSSNALTVTGAGSCVVTASQPGGSGFLPAAPVMQTLTIAQAVATLSFSDLTQGYSGSPESVTMTVVPAGLTINETYNGSSVFPTAPGTYVVVSTVSDPNYTGTASEIFTISPVATVSLAASSVTPVFGAPVVLTATVSPSNLTGKVLFLDNQSPLGVAALVNGTATLTTPLLSAGGQNVTVNYLGQSAPVTVTATPKAETGLIVQPVMGGFTETYMTVLADVNNDGYPDLLTMDDVMDQVGVQLGSANGTFSAPVFYQIYDNGGQFAVYQILAADFNGDGNVDIAAITNTGYISIFIGNGDGTFQSEVTLQVPGISNTYCFTAGDFNGDGNVDLAITGDNTYTVLMGNGDATFTILNTIAQDYFTGFSNVADINADGKADLILQENNSGIIHVLLGNGDGTFGTDYATGSNVYSALGVSVADFNNDGKLDLLTASNDVVLVFLGLGDGTFGTPAIFSNESPYAVASGDFNGDGNQDFVVANGGQGTVDVFLGDGTGAFAFAFSGPAPPDDGNFLPYAFAVGDFNGDGYTDLAVPGYDANVAIYYGTPLGGLQVSLPNSLSFTQGQNGATFTATVTNGGANPTVGTVTAVVQLPDGLTATALAGTGWTCTLNTLTCTRTDTLAATLAYPGITVTVNVSPTAASSLTASVTVTGTVTGFPNNVTGNAAVTVSPTTTLLPQTITFNGFTSHTYGDIPFTVGATASSGLPVSYTASGTCTVTGGLLTITGAGSCMVTAAQAGNSTYAAAASVMQTLTVAKATATVTLGNLGQTYTGTPSPATAVTNPASLAVTITYNGLPTVPTAVGTYAVVATISDPNYMGSALGALVISQATQTQTITFAAPGSQTYGGAPFTVSATATSGLVVTFSASGNCTLTGGVVSVTGAGSCVITANQNGNNVYAPATPVSYTVTIAKASATIALGNLTQPYTGTASAVTALTSPATLSVSITYNGSPTPPTAPGSYAVVASISNANYQGTATGTLVIAQSQTITFTAFGPHAFGDAPFALAATASSGLPVTFTASGSCSLSGAIVTLTGAGLCTVTANQAGNGTYAAAGAAVQTLAIAKGAATIALSGLNQLFTGSPLGVSVVTTPTGLPVVISYNSSHTPPTAPGTYAVTATINDPNYQGSASGSLVIASEAISVMWSPGPLTYGSPLSAAQLDATATVPGTFVYSPPAGTLLGAGPQTLTVTFTPAGGQPISRSLQFTVMQAAAAISFAPIGNHLSTDAPFALTASANSGVPVTFSVLSGPATISGNMLTITGNGTVVVQAASAASANYLAGVVTQAFLVGNSTAPSVSAVVNSASYAQGVATPGYLASLFGVNLASGVLSAITRPLPTQLGGASVEVMDSSGQSLPAELLFVSRGQINFLVPTGAKAGAGTVTVSIAGATTVLAIQIGGTHPGLFSANSAGTGAATGNALHVAADGTEIYAPLSSCSGTPAVCTSLPVAFSSPTDRVFLVLYGTGIRGATSPSAVTVTIAGQTLPVLYAGPQNQFEGLDQINVELPRSLAGAGTVTIQVSIAGQAANPLSITMQ